jgi:hypothetical protein
MCQINQKAAGISHLAKFQQLFIKAAFVRWSNGTEGCLKSSAMF